MFSLSPTVRSCATFVIDGASKLGLSRTTSKALTLGLGVATFYKLDGTRPSSLTSITTGRFEQVRAIHSAMLEVQSLTNELKSAIDQLKLPDDHVSKQEAGLVIAKQKYGGATQVQVRWAIDDYNNRLKERVAQCAKRLKDLPEAKVSVQYSKDIPASFLGKSRPEFMALDTREDSGNTGVQVLRNTRREVKIEATQIYGIALALQSGVGEHQLSELDQVDQLKARVDRDASRMTRSVKAYLRENPLSGLEAVASSLKKVGAVVSAVFTYEALFA